jgi:hypothetical protein
VSDRVRERHLGPADLVLELEGGKDIADGGVWAEIVLFQYSKESEGCKELGEGADRKAGLRNVSTTQGPLTLGVMASSPCARPYVLNTGEAPDKGAIARETPGISHSRIRREMRASNASSNTAGMLSGPVLRSSARDDMIGRAWWQACDEYEVLSDIGVQERVSSLSKGVSSQRRPSIRPLW